MIPIARRLVASGSLKRSCIRTFSAAGNEFLVVNAVGPDRPGIVSELTKLVIDQGGNVGESQASRIGSHFGLMMLITVPKANTLALQSAVQTVNNMSTSCYLTSDPSSIEVVPKDGYTGAFELHGADNPGIVHKVTKILAKHRLSIDEMKTFEDKSAPYGGLSLFHMGGVATSPAPLAKGFDPDVIRDELEELGEELNCDITLEDFSEKEQMRA